MGCHSGDLSEIKSQHPNIVYILADDLGYGDVSCHVEHPVFTTPHIDGLARNGMRFTDAHSNAVCTPTRYTILTGRYAWRTRLKAGVTWSYDLPLINKDRRTVADVLGEQGYHTAAIGKWHLGLGWSMDSGVVTDITNPLSEGPLDLGFDYFYGITASLDIPPYIYIEDDRSTSNVIDTIEAMTGKAFWRKGPIADDFDHKEVLSHLTEKAVQYIKQQAIDPDPFFLYFALPAPHTPILPADKFKASSGTNEYGDFVLMVDDVVGQIVQTLDNQGLLDNTLLIFTSDNGCSPMADFEELASFGHRPNGLFRGGKADVYEGGHRIPFLAQWPGRIPKNSTSEALVGLVDFMATAAALVKDTLTADTGEDSYSILPHLLGEKVEIAVRNDLVHQSINGSFAIRSGPWKLALCPGSGGWSHPTPDEAKSGGLPEIQLYNLVSDPAETRNVYQDHPELVRELKGLLKQYVSNGRSTNGPPQSNDTETLLPFE